MKILLFAVLLTMVTAGLASAGGGHPTNRYSACAHSNSKECTDARNAFAAHHGGKYPDQFYNQWYQGQQGRWDQHGKDWRWDGANGEQYRKEHNQWEWVKHHNKHDRDDHDAH